MKWMSYLMAFNIVIRYKKGITNKLADMLSRPSVSVSALVMAMQIQSLVPANYATWYVTDESLKDVYAKAQTGQKVEFEIRDGLLYKGS